MMIQINEADADSRELLTASLAHAPTWDSASTSPLAVASGVLGLLWGRGHVRERRAVLQETSKEVHSLRAMGELMTMTD